MAHVAIKLFKLPSYRMTVVQNLLPAEWGEKGKMRGGVGGGGQNKSYAGGNFRNMCLMVFLSQKCLQNNAANYLW
jgi:hypothetical protein